jgi:preflagellin peptidase FlaK
MNPFDTARILISTPFLLYACYTDIKERRVTNRVWIIMGTLGLFIDAIELPSLGWSFIKFFLFQVVFIFVLAYLMYYLGAYGGADAKALMALSLMFPFYPAISSYFPVFRTQVGIFAFTVFSNAVVLSLVLPILMFVRNFVLLKKDFLKNPYYSVVGYQVDVDKIPFHAKLLEYPENGRLVRSRRGIWLTSDLEKELKAMKLKGVEKIWITPGIPFLIPITIGFYTALFVGDILFTFLSKIIPMV